MSELLNLKEGALETRLSIYTLWSWVNQKRIPFVRLGRRVFLKKSDLDKMIQTGYVPASEKK